MIRFRICSSLLFVSLCIVVCDGQSQPIADFDITMYHNEIIYHDTHELLLMIVNDGCVFIHFPSDLSVLLTDPGKRANFVRHMLSSFHHNHLMPSSLDAVRDKYTDRLADFHCTDKNIFEAVVCDYDNGWHRFEMSCYQLHTHPATLTNALLHCRDDGGYLVEITSLEENTYVEHIMGTEDRAWIGVGQLHTGGEWVLLSDQSPLNFTHWDPHSGSSTEHCAYLDSGRHTWHYEHCYDHYSFVCERSD